MPHQQLALLQIPAPLLLAQRGCISHALLLPCPWWLLLYCRWLCCCPALTLLTSCSGGSR
jgi:hypothetical protein